MILKKDSSNFNPRKKINILSQIGSKYRKSLRNTEPFIFIFAPNNSGTTVLSQLLAENLQSAYLPPFGNNEGQWIPEVREMMRNNPWNTKNDFNWVNIKACWLKYLNQSHKDLFIEASPPNMMKVDKILKEFNPTRCIFYISNPYLQIASCIHRYSKNMTIETAIEHYTALWTMKAKVLQSNCQTHPKIPLITYENLCSNSRRTLERITSGLDKKQSYASNIPGKKNSNVNKIINMQPRHMAFLGRDGIEKISNLLKSEQEVLTYFGYYLITMKQANKMLQENPLLSNEGLAQRLKWDAVNSD